MTSADELLWHVDVQDVPLGARTRADVHALRLLHRSVHMLVSDPDGNILLQLRSGTKDENPGLWDTSAAGHVDYGESYDDSARRELGEELGIHVAVEALHFLFRMEALPEFGSEFVQVYQVVWNGPLQLSEAEISEVRWFTPEQLDHAVAMDNPAYTGTFKRLWRLYRSSSLVAIPSSNSAK